MLCLLLPCFSQDKEINVKGIVVDEHNTPIPEVFISVNWGKRGLLSRDDGTFYITANLQDTLVFKHTSFEPKAIAISYVGTNDTIKVQLTERTLTLGEVEINNWGTWQDFKDKIQNMDADSIRQTNEYRLETMFGYKKRNPIKNPYFRGQPEPKINPLTIIGSILSGGLPRMLYNKYSSKEKRRRKIQAEKIQELTVEQNEYRYNEELLGKILNLKGQKLHAFKIYCDYALNFNQNDHKLLKQINALYKNWKNTKTTLGQDSLKENTKTYTPIQSSPFRDTEH